MLWGAVWRSLVDVASLPHCSAVLGPWTDSCSFARLLLLPWHSVVSCAAAAHSHLQPMKYAWAAAVSRLWTLHTRPKINRLPVGTGPWRRRCCHCRCVERERVGRARRCVCDRTADGCVYSSCPVSHTSVFFFIKFIIYTFVIPFFDGIHLLDQEKKKQGNWLGVAEPLALPSFFLSFFLPCSLPPSVSRVVICLSLFDNLSPLQSGSSVIRGCHAPIIKTQSQSFIKHSHL